jgi:ankyrin repeat protein
MLLHIAAINGPTNVVELLIKKVLMLIKQIVDGLLYIELLAMAIKE